MTLVGCGQFTQTRIGEEGKPRHLAIGLSTKVDEGKERKRRRTHFSAAKMEEHSSHLQTPFPSLEHVLAVPKKSCSHPKSAHDIECLFSVHSAVSLIGNHSR
jgi:hypothetical protein